MANLLQESQLARGLPCLLILLLGAACSAETKLEGKGSGGNAPAEGSYRAAVLDVLGQMDQPVRTWADGVVGEFREQLQTSGTFDVDAVEAKVRPRTDAVGTAACNAIKKHEKVLKEERDLPDVARPREFPMVELARATGKEPTQLYAMKLEWPDPWLLAAKAQPDYGAPFDPKFLTRFLKPEFVGQAGEANFPTPGSPEYPNFIGWLYGGKTIANHTSLISAPIQHEIDACMPAK